MRSCLTSNISMVDKTLIISIKSWWKRTNSERPIIPFTKSIQRTNSRQLRPVSINSSNKTTVQAKLTSSMFKKLLINKVPIKIMGDSCTCSPIKQKSLKSRATCQQTSNSRVDRNRDRWVGLIQSISNQVKITSLTLAGTQSGGLIQSWSMKGLIFQSLKRNQATAKYATTKAIWSRKLHPSYSTLAQLILMKLLRSKKPMTIMVR